MKTIYTPKSPKELEVNANLKKKSAEIDDFRWTTADKRRLWHADAARLDACLKNEDGKEFENGFLSDNGKGAADIRRCGEDDSVESADWFNELYNAVDTLNDTEKKIVFALLRDLRPQVAARLANTNRMRVYRTMDKLRSRFAKAHSLWQHRRE